uniref:TRAF3-interacting protein 1 n=1 Tax=Chromera velia CCMP2878 TaxID=1169474 RepID=A0A0G4H2K2_9ALVE|eukprot:Cvel_24432.t1-p1 / transcript=Cvel_24432.t1 / gene=Cvel_24432 / organism=Chromera_velia_CCMP2878 / gene_product=TRAF3-interacting protein 1, putative / transcript_product=TRAF3-interacting protein 1, putative / location=Cvel_scaffold2640:11581-13646(+) / protein_length=500 / sequence_SO=supercontig / SO=protein_coding / is_pseudo=false
MAAEHEEWMDPVQQTIGQLISKPKMTDKYLKRPPFRFLHDTISEVLRVTKYAPGLFTEEEMDCGNLKDKGTKVAYLEKIVDCVGLELGETVEVSTSKIVAGLEPENTNAFLVQLHKAATTSKDGGAATVQRIHAGEKMPRKKKKAPAAAEAAPEKEKKAPPPPPEPAGPSAEELEEAERQRREEEAEAERKRQKEKEAAERRRREKEKAAEEERRAKEQEESRSQGPNLATVAGFDRPATAGRRPPKPKRRDSNTSDTQQLPGGAAGGGGSGGRALDGTIVGVSSTAARGPAPAVMTEGPEEEEEDADMFVQAAPRKGTSREGPAQVDEGGEGHGRLVRHILQSKKEAQEAVEAQRRQREAEEEREREEQQRQSGGIRLGKIRRKAGASVQYDIEALRGDVQQLVQATNPLGKSVDHVHADVATMSKELEQWRTECRTMAAKYSEEVRKTDEQLAPLEQKAAQLDEEIREATARLHEARARVFRHQQTIQSLLDAVVSAR